MVQLYFGRETGDSLLNSLANRWNYELIRAARLKACDSLSRVEMHYLGSRIARNRSYRLRVFNHRRFLSVLLSQLWFWNDFRSSDKRNTISNDALLSFKLRVPRIARSIETSSTFHTRLNRGGKVLDEFSIRNSWSPPFARSIGVRSYLVGIICKQIWYKYILSRLHSWIIRYTLRI